MPDRRIIVASSAPWDSQPAVSVAELRAWLDGLERANPGGEIRIHMDVGDHYVDWAVLWDPDSAPEQAAQPAAPPMLEMQGLDNARLSEIRARDDDADIQALLDEIDFQRAKYNQLRDALCSPAWLPRNNHSRVVELARIMRGREGRVYA